jgi:hypothetical protein
MYPVGTAPQCHSMALAAGLRHAKPLLHNGFFGRPHEREAKDSRQLVPWD